MKANKRREYLILFVSLIVISLGFYLVIYANSLTDSLNLLPYFIIGIGCIGFGYTGGKILSDHYKKKNPDLLEEFEIEATDERNQLIGYRAKSKAFEAYLMIFGLLIAALALVGIDLWLILLLACAYLATIIYMLILTSKYSKEI